MAGFMRQALIGVTALLAGIGLSLLPVAPAQAVIIDFEQAPAGPGGVLTWDGTNATGTAILLGTLTVSDAPVFGVFALSNTTLDFDTGDVSNFIMITGGVPGLGIADGTTLLSGTFDSFLVQVVGTILAVSGTGPDEKDPEFLRALGLNPDVLSFHFFGSSLSGNFDGTTGTATSTDVLNVNPVSVAEPTSFLLLGVGLVAVGILGRRRGFLKGPEA